MKKLLGILVLGLFWCNVSVADNDPCSFTWKKNKINIWATFFVENKSTSSQVAKISSATIYTKDGQKMHTEIFDPPIYVKPFSKKQFNVVKEELLWDLAGQASISCYPITFGMYEVETKPENNTSFKIKCTGFRKHKVWPSGDGSWDQDDVVGWCFESENPQTWLNAGAGAVMALIMIFFGIKMFTKQSSSKKSRKVKVVYKTKNSENIIEKVWNGNETMSKIFWLYMVVVQTILMALLIFLGIYIGKIIVIIQIVFAIWASIGLWKSSDKYKFNKIKNKQPYGWSIVAKIFSVFNLLDALAIVFFIFKGS